MSKKKAMKIGILVMVTIFSLLAVSCSIGETLCTPEETTESTEVVEQIQQTEATTETTEAPTEPAPTTKPTEPPHEHIYAEEITVEADCEKAEITVFTCECGESHKEETKPALGHEYTEKIIEPTYKAGGYTEHTCNRCEHTYKDNETDKVPHTCSYTESVVKPTCTDKGYTSHKCKLCDKVYKDNYTDMIEHVYTNKVVAPTCQAEGYTLHTCKCGKEYKDSTTAKIACNFKTVKTEKPTCTAEGYTLTKCSMCNKEKKIDTVAMLSHTYGNYKSDKNETCEKDGTKTATCSVCGKKHTVTNENSKTGHSLSNWSDGGAAQHSRHCTKEECPYVEAKPHTYDKSKVIAPTCTTAGHTEKYCECGKVGTKVDEVKALGHDYGSVKTVAPTYTSEGYDVQVCSRCQNEIKTNYTPKVPHDCTYKDKVTKPTCIDKGYTTHTCSICGNVKTDTYTDPVGHTYKDKVVAPTCEADGYTSHTCSVCKHSYNTDTVKATGHDYKTTTVEATTGWAGYDLHKCKTCGHSYKDNEKAKLAADQYPKGYQDSTCKIVIYKEWYENAYVYAAHITFTDYDRLWMECANGKYNSGGETTSHAAKRVGAILAINGDYAVPGNGAGGYAIARKGVVCNDKIAYPEGIYNSNTGRLTFGHKGVLLSELVAAGEVTDTFQFGPVCLKDGVVIGDPSSTSRAQRTFIGTNGNAGDIWLCVSDGRYNDGKSAGLNGYQCGAYMKSKGCTLCVPLDGGGSSTIYFNGQVLNAAKNGQRSVVDFLMFK